MYVELTTVIEVEDHALDTATIARTIRRAILLSTEVEDRLSPKLLYPVRARIVEAPEPAPAGGVHV